MLEYRNKNLAIQIDIKKLEQRLIDLESSFKIFFGVSIDPKLGTLTLKKEVLKKHEAIITCSWNAKKIVKYINDSKLLYSLNRWVKQIQGRDGKTFEDGLETLQIYSHAGIELTWEDDILILNLLLSHYSFSWPHHPQLQEQNVFLKCMNNSFQLHKSSSY